MTYCACAPRNGLRPPAVENENEARCCGDGARPAGTGNQAFEKGQNRIGRQSQQRRHDASEQHEDPILGLQTGEDVISQARLADRRRQRRRPDHQRRCRPDARHDDGQRQRQLHLQQRLQRCHADAERRLLGGGIDAEEPSHGVPQDRQHGVERQRE